MPRPRRARRAHCGHAQRCAAGGRWRSSGARQAGWYWLGQEPQRSVLSKPSELPHAWQNSFCARAGQRGAAGRLAGSGSRRRHRRHWRRQRQLSQIARSQPVL